MQIHAPGTEQNFCLGIFAWLLLSTLATVRESVMCLVYLEPFVQPASHLATQPASPNGNAALVLLVHSLLMATRMRLSLNF